MALQTSPLFPGLFHDAATRVADLCDRSEPAADRAWRQALADGWTSVLVAEAHGGVGGTLADAAAIVEGLAARDAWLPVVERCVAVPLLLEACPEMLAAAASGEVRFGLMAAADGAGAERQASAIGEVDQWLMRADAADGPVLLARDAAELSPRLQRFFSADGQPLLCLQQDDAAPSGWRTLASGPAVARAAHAADDAAMFLACVDATAALGALLEQTVAHLNTRVQFGASLSSQQVLRHRGVDIYLVHEAARGLVARCQRLLDAGSPGASGEIALAKLYLGHAGRSAAEAAIQLHGAIGMSEELPAARLARRIVVDDFRRGDRLRQEAALSATLAARIDEVWA